MKNTPQRHISFIVFASALRKNVIPEYSRAHARFPSENLQNEKALLKYKVSDSLAFKAAPHALG
jgi:hypothetical protein